MNGLRLTSVNDSLLMGRKPFCISNYWQGKRQCVDLSYIISYGGMRPLSYVPRKIPPRRYVIDMMKGIPSRAYDAKNKVYCRTINREKLAEKHPDYEELLSELEQKQENIKKVIPKKSEQKAYSNFLRTYKDKITKSIHEDFLDSKTYEENFPMIFKHIPDVSNKNVQVKSYKDIVTGPYDLGYCNKVTNLYKSARTSLSQLVCYNSLHGDDFASKERLRKLRHKMNLTKVEMAKNKTIINNRERKMKKESKYGVEVMPEKDYIEAKENWLKLSNRFDVLKNMEHNSSFDQGELNASIAVTCAMQRYSSYDRKLKRRKRLMEPIKENDSPLLSCLLKPPVLRVKDKRQIIIRGRKSGRIFGNYTQKADVYRGKRLRKFKTRLSNLKFTKQSESLLYKIRAKHSEITKYALHNPVKAKKMNPQLNLSWFVRWVDKIGMRQNDLGEGKLFIENVDELDRLLELDVT